MRFIIIVILIIQSLYSNAQSISGKILNKEGVPVQHIPVILIKGIQITDVKSTDEKGGFAFEKLKPGQYSLKTRQLGEETILENIVEITQENQDIVLRDFTLEETSLALEELTITASRNMLQYDVDKTILDIEALNISSDRPVIEVLTMIPEVSLESGDKITILGKENVQIWVNGRPSKLKITDIPLAQISKIEVISNPSAQYDSNVDAVINLVLKRWTDEGLYGNINLSYRQGIYSHQNIGGILNYNKRNFQISLNTQYNDKRLFHESSFTQQYIDQVPTLLQKGVNQQFGKDKYYYTNVHATWNLPKKHQLGVYSELAAYRTPSYQNKQEEEFTLQGSEVSDSTLYSNSRIKNTSIDLITGVNYVGRLNDKIRFRIASDYTLTTRDRQTDFSFQRTYPNSGIAGVSSLFSGEDPIHAHLYSSLANITHQISEKTTWEYGVKGTFIRTMYEPTYTGEDTYIVNDKNYFDYDEDIFGAYVTWKKKWKRFYASIGVRGEYSSMKGLFKQEENSNVKRDLFRIFPSVSWMYNLENAGKLNFSYRQGVKRVSFLSIAPYNYYTSPYTLFEGNPQLNNQFTETVSLKYIYKDFTVVTYYTSIDDFISQLSTLENTLLTYKQDNYGFTTYGVSVSMPVEINSWWKSYQKLSFRNISSDGYIEEQKFDESSAYLSAYLKESFQLWKKLNLDFILTYRTPYTLGIYRNERPLLVDCSISKSFWKDKISLGIYIKDLFHQYKTKMKVDFENQNRTVIHREDYQSISFSLKYSFSKGKKAKQRPHQVIDRENRNRVK